MVPSPTRFRMSTLVLVVRRRQMKIHSLYTILYVQRHLTLKFRSDLSVVQNIWIHSKVNCFSYIFFISGSNIYLGDTTQESYLT